MDLLPRSSHHGASHRRFSGRSDWAEYDETRRLGNAGPERLAIREAVVIARKKAEKEAEREAAGLPAHDIADDLPPGPRMDSGQISHQLVNISS